MKPSIPAVLATFALACFALLQNAQAVSPPPDGGYPGGNTAEGESALLSLTSGVWNTALGYQALSQDTTGNQNTATGFQTLFHNTTGSLSTAYGPQSLYNNTTGSLNTATGFRTLFSNTTGSFNTGNGFEALAFNTTGYDNTASGYFALFRNTIGNNNAAYGDFALVNNTTGAANTAIGEDALEANTTGDWNTAIGGGALGGNSTGSYNVALGAQAGLSVTTADNVICIGYGVAGTGVSNRCYIGNIYGVTPSLATAVYVNSLGQLGTIVSSRRFKDEIKPMNKASEAVLALKPVTFRYKQDIDPAGTSQFGLVAEDVEKINPDLVLRDKEGKPYSVRYDQVNAMLLNEFLKEHRKVEDLEANDARQQKQIEVLTAGLQKVSAQLEASKSAAQVVNNP